jgi:hypothetical protein
MQNSRKKFYFRQPLLHEKCFHDGEYLRFQLQIGDKNVGKSSCDVSFIFVHR